MEIVEHINNIERPYDNAVITIGNFDGVHIGHQALFHEVIEKADTIGGTYIVMHFQTQPVRVSKTKLHSSRITI